MNIVKTGMTQWSQIYFVEGVLQAETKHGVRYIQLIGSEAYMSQHMRFSYGIGKQQRIREACGDFQTP